MQELPNNGSFVAYRKEKDDEISNGESQFKPSFDRFRNTVAELLDELNDVELTGYHGSSYDFEMEKFVKEVIKSQDIAGKEIDKLEIPWREKIKNIDRKYPQFRGYWSSDTESDERDKEHKI